MSDGILYLHVVSGALKRRWRRLGPHQRKHAVNVALIAVLALVICVTIAIDPEHWREAIAFGVGGYLFGLVANWIVDRYVERTGRNA